MGILMKGQRLHLITKSHFHPLLALVLKSAFLCLESAPGRSRSLWDLWAVRVNLQHESAQGLLRSNAASVDYLGLQSPGKGSAQLTMELSICDKYRGQKNIIA